MKNRTSTSSTSTSEITLISGSSLERLCSFIRNSADDARALLLREQVQETNRFLLDGDDQAVDAAAQIAVRDQRRNGDREARGRRDQRLGDAARKHGRVANALLRDR